MKADAIKLDGGKAGSVDLDEAIFGLEPRADILHRVVRWQRNNAQAGTHKVKTRSETSYSTSSEFNQTESTAKISFRAPDTLNVALADLEAHVIGATLATPGGATQEALEIAAAEAM